MQFAHGEVHAGWSGISETGIMNIVAAPQLTEKCYKSANMRRLILGHACLKGLSILCADCMIAMTWTWKSVVLDMQGAF